MGNCLPRADSETCLLARRGCELTGRSAPEACGPGLYIYSVKSRAAACQPHSTSSDRQIGGSEFLILNQQFNTSSKRGCRFSGPWICSPIVPAHPNSGRHFSNSRSRPGGEVSLRTVAEAGVFPSVLDGDSRGEKSGNLPAFWTTTSLISA